MTRARALKQTIRDRAAKTGERYTTARRHVLHELNQKNARSTLASPASPASPKGALSDAKSIEKTGHDLAHWFGVLDCFGGVAKGHTALAKHIHEDHGVPGWYCQGITVAYERAHGARAMNQSCDGDFHVSVSKMVPLAAPRAAKLFSDARQRRRWTATVDAALAAGLAAGIKAKGIVTRADGQSRFRYKWNGTTVQFYLYPKGAAKTSIVVDHMNLPGNDAVEDFRARWKQAFAALSDTVK